MNNEILTYSVTRDFYKYGTVYLVVCFINHVVSPEPSAMTSCIMYDIVLARMNTPKYDHHIPIQVFQQICSRLSCVGLPMEKMIEHCNSVID
jgi:hypothetical protein